MEPRVPDPIVLFRRWFAQARRHVELPEAMALATASRDGKPAVRFVLLKAVDDRGFTFFTDARSSKGRDLATNPRAALAFYWDPTRRQVRVAGRVERLTAAESDAYWATRPRESRLAGATSLQSAPIASRGLLLARWRRTAARYRGVDVPRPAEWSGFRVVPDTIEFWVHRNHRLHHREQFTRARRRWRRQLLQP
jgi:pyridoxamine 5'-phosphate oxidase